MSAKGIIVGMRDAIVMGVRVRHFQKVSMARTEMEEKERKSGKEERRKRENVEEITDSGEYVDDGGDGRE